MRSDLPLKVLRRRPLFHVAERLRGCGFHVESAVDTPALQLSLELNLSESADHSRHRIRTGLNVEDKFDHALWLCYLRTTIMGPVERKGFVVAKKYLGESSWFKPRGGGGPVKRGNIHFERKYPLSNADLYARFSPTREAL